MWLNEIYAKANEIICNPHNFFSGIKKEKGIKKALLFYAFFIIVNFVISIGLLPGVVADFASKLNSVSISVGYAAVILGSLLLPFISVFISTMLVHMFVRLLGGKNGYNETFKALVYGLTTMLLFELIMSVISYFPFASAPEKIGVVAGFAILLLTLASVAYTIYLQVLGINIIQKITKWRAFVALVLLPIALAIILIVMLAFIIALVVVLRARSTGL